MSYTWGYLNRVSDVGYMRGQNERKIFVRTVICRRLPLKQDVAGIKIEVRNALEQRSLPEIQ